MDYPLQLLFKTIALAPQVSVTDAGGRLVFYVRQKLFKLKDAVTVFGDAQQTQPLYTINADRVFDFNARFHFADTSGNPIGAVQRMGVRSLWRTHYDIIDNDGNVTASIHEENPWTKVFDSLLGDLPLLGMFTGYFFNPTYGVTRPDGTLVLRLVKRPSFLEGKFSIEKHGQLGDEEETRTLLGLLMMVLLERMKG
jgi:uncharacterized protein YxjI